MRACRALDPAEPARAEPLSEAAAEYHRLHVEQRHRRADADAQRLDGLTEEIPRDLGGAIGASLLVR